MGYRMFDKDGAEVFGYDLQDKGTWCRHGASKEEVFVDQYGKALDLIINPEKETNPYVLDLYHTGRGLYADLKTQNNPHFMSNIRYHIDPNYAVSFNLKDEKRYKEYLKEKKEIIIYFWVNWIPVMFTNNDDIAITVNPTNSIYGIRFSNLLKLTPTAPVHRYAQRVDDRKGNAKESYVLNLSHRFFHKLT